MWSSATLVLDSKYSAISIETIAPVIVDMKYKTLLYLGFYHGNDLNYKSKL